MLYFCYTKRNCIYRKIYRALSATGSYYSHCNLFQRYNQSHCILEKIICCSEVCKWLLNVISVSVFLLFRLFLCWNISAANQISRALLARVVETSLGCHMIDMKCTWVDSFSPVTSWQDKAVVALAPNCCHCCSTD